MIDIPVTPVAEAAAMPKKSPKAKNEKKTAGKSKVAASHPPTFLMVNNAVKDLKDRRGSSLQAIKKYIASTYKVDAEKLAPYIRKAIKNSVEYGTLIQTKGKGASGSFKIAGTVKTKKPATKMSPAVKIAKPKKSPVEKQTSEIKSKSASKAKKSTKVPTKKPKSPKAKTIKKVSSNK